MAGHDLPPGEIARLDQLGAELAAIVQTARTHGPDCTLRPAGKCVGRDAIAAIRNLSCGRRVQLLEEAVAQLAHAPAAAVAAEPDDPVAYLLWSGRHQGWWAPDARGYTADIDRAGRFTQADAVRYVVGSAQAGIRDHATTMVAAPENWTR